MRLLAAIAVLAAAAGAVGLSGAVLTGGTDEAPATFSGGKLALVATPGSTATSTLDTANMRPGAKRSGTVELRNAGTVAARAQLTVKLAAASPLAGLLQLRVEDCADAACAQPAPRFAAALTDVADRPLGPIAAGAARTYRVTLEWPAAHADPALQGATADLQLAWTALAGTSA
jgi:hypothetical protein